MSLDLKEEPEFQGMKTSISIIVPHITIEEVMIFNVEI
jgi:hypothetical protein